MIRTVCLAGSIFYTAIFLLQAWEYHPVIGEAIAGIAIIAILTIISFRTDEHELHRGEMILVWTCILLFSLYALLRAGGVI
jgi:hypothetical protein